MLACGESVCVCARRRPFSFSQQRGNDAVIFQLSSSNGKRNRALSLWDFLAWNRKEDVFFFCEVNHRQRPGGSIVESLEVGNLK